MSRTRIKFCGITSVADALAAAECGADAIGLVLHADSRRRIELTTAREIVRSLPSFVTPVGLFVDAPLEFLDHALASLGLRHIQLHGRETTELAARLEGRAVIKAIHVQRDALRDEWNRWNSVPNIAGLLLDSGSTAQRGGSGVENDWDVIAAACDAGWIARRRLILAGGLRPETVGDVVRRLRPFAVDVSSGIENSPGIKSIDKMRAFAEAVRKADLL